MLLIPQMADLVYEELQTRKSFNKRHRLIHLWRSAMASLNAGSKEGFRTLRLVNALNDWVWKTTARPVCCIHCGVALYRKQMTVEHIIPKSRGGGDDRENLAPACAPCNLRRGNKRIA